MALTGKAAAQKKYDGEECWNKFMEMGAAATVRKLNNWSRERYGSVSQMGPYWAMWRYASRNVDEAWEQYRKWWHDTASTAQVYNVPKFVDKVDFLKDCQRHIKGTGDSKRNSVLGIREYRRWCAKWGLEE